MLVYCTQVHGMLMQLEDRMQLFDMHKPVIAQIHGNCLAGGNGDFYLN